MAPERTKCFPEDLKEQIYRLDTFGARQLWKGLGKLSMELFRFVSKIDLVVWQEIGFGKRCLN